MYFVQYSTYPCGKLSGRLFALVDGKAVRLPSPSPLPPLSKFPPISHLLFTDPSSFLSHISFISDMSRPSSSSNFQILFDAALRDYKDKTGNSLTDHPIAKQLETCESVNSITDVLQEQASRFRELRESDGRLMKALNSSVDVLCAPFIGSALNGAIGLVVSRKAFTGVHFF